MESSKTVQFKVLEQELRTYKKALIEAADTIAEQDVSDYPIFVLFREEVEIGIPLIDRETVAGNWSVNASTMEEFIARQIIGNEKVESFKSLFESHDNHICLFVISEVGADFVFSPR